jgi:ABC-type cobalt transport system substrate-binding protein
MKFRGARGRQLLVALALVLVVSGLTFALSISAAEGSDDRAALAVDSLTDGAYEPWIQSAGVPGGERNEPLFFGLQALVGVAVLAGCFWYWRGLQSET